MRQPIRILAADDHPIVIDGLRKIFEKEPDIVVAGQASDAHQILCRIEEGNYDIVLLDISIPGRSGLDVLKDIRALAPDLPVIMLTMHAEEHYAMRCLKAGAAGYVTKKSISNELIDAVRKVAGGEKYVSASLVQILACSVESAGKRLPHETLSDREFEVVCLLAHSRTVGEIAGELSLSRQAVTTYRARALKKLSMYTNAELANYVALHDLPHPPTSRVGQRPTKTSSLKLQTTIA